MSSQPFPAVFSDNEGSGLFKCDGPVTNCIVYGNEAYQLYRCSGPVTWSNIQGCYQGSNNIDTDPLFADPDNGDFRLKSQYGRWIPEQPGYWILGDPNDTIPDIWVPATDAQWV